MAREFRPGNDERCPIGLRGTEPRVHQAPPPTRQLRRASAERPAASRRSTGRRAAAPAGCRGAPGSAGTRGDWLLGSSSHDSPRSTRVRLERAPPQLEERPQRSRSAPHSAGQPARAAPAQHAHQHRLDLVVARCAPSRSRAPSARAPRRAGSVPRVAPRRLASARRRRLRRAAGPTPPASPRGARLARRRAPPRRVARAPRAVVERRDGGDACGATAAMASQQRHGIQPAGDGEQQRRIASRAARRAHRVARPSRRGVVIHRARNILRARLATESPASGSRRAPHYLARAAHSIITAFRSDSLETHGPLGTLWVGLGLCAFYIALVWINTLLGFLLTPLFIVPLTWLQDKCAGRLPRVADRRGGSPCRRRGRDACLGARPFAFSVRRCRASCRRPARSLAPARRARAGAAGAPPLARLAAPSRPSTSSFTIRTHIASGRSRSRSASRRCASQVGHRRRIRARPRRVHIVVDDPDQRRQRLRVHHARRADDRALAHAARSARPRSATTRVWQELLATHEFAHVAHLTRPSRNRWQRLLWSLSPVPLGPIATRVRRAG